MIMDSSKEGWVGIPHGGIGMGGYHGTGPGDRAGCFRPYRTGISLALQFPYGRFRSAGR